jgi:hypothetical protein
MKARRVVLLAILAGLILAACGNDDPSRTPVKGAERLSLTFDEAGRWEEGVYTDENGAPESTLAIIDGRYQIDFRAARSASFTWGAGGEAYENVIVEVETDQLSSEKDNLYGVMCRLAPDDRGNMTGYALLISGDGHYGIAELKGRSLDFLLAWHQSKAIKQGPAHNTIRAVCVDDYFAVYVNDQFLGEVKNDAYRRAGQVGLLAGVTGEGTVSIAFDNLTVYEGTLK